MEEFTMTNQTTGNQTPKNQGQGNQSQGNQGQSKPNQSSTSRADQPTPVSSSSQSLGNQQGQGSGDIKQVGRELANDAKKAVSSATDEVKSQVNELTNVAQEQTTQFLGEQKDMAASRIEGVAHALRQAGQELAGRDEGTLAQYTDSLAGQLDNFSTTLRNREIGSLIDDARQLAHRQPELFVAGALAAGFVLGRFFKSSRRATNGYRTNYNSNYDSSYGQNYSQGYAPDYYQEYDRGYNEVDQRTGSRGYGYQGGYQGGSYQSSGYQNDYSFDEQSRSQWNRPASQSDQWSQGTGERYGQYTGQSTGQYTGQNSGQTSLRGQEFGQGEEQVSNYKGTENATAGDLGKRPNQRDEGELK
jgi:hypothetical protein